MPKLTSYTKEMGSAAQELSQARARPLFSRVRFQVLFLLVISFLALLVSSIFGIPASANSWKALWTPQSQVSFVWAMLASVSALWLVHMLTQYPGLTKAPYVLPSTISAYGIVILLMFFLRIDYSRYVISISFLTCCVWLQSYFYTMDRGRDYALAVVPSKNDEALWELKGANWIKLSSPKDSLVGVAGVVVNLHADLPSEWNHFIAQCTLAGIPVYDTKNIAETLTGQVDAVHLSETVFGSLLPSNAYLRIKRGADFLSAIVLLPFFAFVIAIAAILIKIESKGPVFFKQERVGFRAKRFQIYKLRSMKVEELDGGHFTEDDDPRITTVGRFLRKYRIDEFPQIFNIIKGDMSWIGPRPESVTLVELYSEDIPFHIYRHVVRPGISGWAQVNQGYVGEVSAEMIKLRYDFYYIKYFSPFLDILIVLRTFHTMLTGFGSK